MVLQVPEERKKIALVVEMVMELLQVFLSPKHSYSQANKCANALGNWDWDLGDPMIFY